MKKTILAIVAAATLATATLGASSEANAYCRGCVAGGIAAGIIGGAIIGSAIANSHPYAYPRAYYPVAGYEPYPVYAAAPPYSCPGGYWARRPIRDGWGHVVGWSRPRWFCPY
jgi:hypothetical protein